MSFVGIDLVRLVDSTLIFFLVGVEDHLKYAVCGWLSKSHMVMLVF